LDSEIGLSLRSWATKAMGTLEASRTVLEELN
jgi:hypothetical protein